jgi:Na+/alanine symporter
LQAIFGGISGATSAISAGLQSGAFGQTAGNVTNQTAQEITYSNNPFTQGIQSGEINLSLNDNIGITNTVTGGVKQFGPYEEFE